MTPITLNSAPLAAPVQPCANSFIAHTLDYTTLTDGEVVSQFDGAGAGVAVNDINDDGRPDIVLANLNGPSAIFWNEGNFVFRKETLSFGHSRDVNIVDVDGDGRLDVIFTRTADGPVILHNTGSPSGSTSFVEQTPFFHLPAYAMNWADLNGDGALDVVMGTYNAELQAKFGALWLNKGAGVYYYEQQGHNFVPHILAEKSQASAIAFPDLNGDGKPDILVGAFAPQPDQAWIKKAGRWVATRPFSATTTSTTGFDLADLDNAGRPALLAAHIKPDDISVKALADWLPLTTAPVPGGPQIRPNVLQVRGQDGHFRDEAASRMVDATGWSWSAKFGDLDNDGFLDLYVVNGMIAHDFLAYLPGDKLVDENRALRNDGAGHFAPAPQWELGSTAGGRGMTMADLNNDGRLDIVVNNLGSPAQVFENRLCGGAGLEVDLAWPGSRNRRALGAQLALHTSAGTYYRDARAASGYLSGDPARIHFGIPEGAKLEGLEIRWPDGRVSRAANLAAQTLVIITRSS